MDTRALGLLLVVAGLVAVALGLLAFSGALSWFGRLPGDLRWESGNTRVYIPLTTMLILSIAVSAALYILQRLR